MPPKITSTRSCSTSFEALASATLSVVALSSRYRSICRPNKPPFALMSLITILATFALAIPRNESGPVWSVITPTLMDRPTEVVDSFMAFSPRKTGYWWIGAGFLNRNFLTARTVPIVAPILDPRQVATDATVLGILSATLPSEQLGPYSQEILSVTYADCLDSRSLNYMPQCFERNDLNFLLDLEGLTEKRLLG